MAGGDVKCREGTRVFSWERKKRNRTGRGGKAGLCKKEWVGVKDIQRGPTVVVSDAGVASTYPANAHQEPDTHTHTHPHRPGPKYPKEPCQL